MNYFELKTKITELIKADKSKSNIVKTDESALRATLLEVKKEMELVELQLDNKAKLQDSKKTLATKFNELCPEEERIFNCNTLSLENKVAQLVKICALKSETILDLDNTIKQLASLEEEMVNNEVSKKMDLLPMWKEVKSIYEVDDLEEIEISDSHEVDELVSKEPDENLDTLLEELKKELSTSSDNETQKTSFFSSIFGKKGA